MRVSFRRKIQRHIQSRLVVALTAESLRASLLRAPMGTSLKGNPSSTSGRLEAHQGKPGELMKGNREETGRKPGSCWKNESPPRETGGTDGGKLGRNWEQTRKLLEKRKFTKGNRGTGGGKTRGNSGDYQNRGNPPRENQEPLPPPPGRKRKTPGSCPRGCV